MKNSPSCAHVLQKTLNLVISRGCFAGDGKEMYKNINATCTVVVLVNQTHCFVAFSWSSTPSLLKLTSVAQDAQKDAVTKIVV